MLSLSFWLTSLCVTGSSFIHLIRTEFKWILFNGWAIFHGVYVPQLPYPFICWWASRLLPCPGYYKQCCDVCMKNRKRDTDVQNRFLDSVGEGKGGMFWENSIETCVLSRVKQITSPGWMHEISAQGWCTGKTQRDVVGREVGGGIGMGNTCKSMADSCQCMAKTTTVL